MHYKIASLILNASKHQTGAREVFIAQPDAQKEALAGKIFLMAEIGGKKSEAKSAIDFILDAVERFFYQDEKIFLQEKIEGLSLENIFEAAVTKINRALLEFLNSEKIFLQPEESSIVLGLIFEDKLFFANFGRHKAFLIYKKESEYELINVEASAADSPETDSLENDLNPKFFSSVISGKIPPASYFLFCNDVLMEYLSNKELINIISKLPPVVAAEQIKTFLTKLNSYVPFLGIIVKNTYGLSMAELKDEAKIEILKSAHNSISHLNNTEARTEQMLSPAGLFNFKKLKKLFQNISEYKQGLSRKKTSRDKKSLENEPILPSVTQVNTSSRLIKEKMIFGRSHSKFFKVFRLIGPTLINIFNPIFWQQNWKSMRRWLTGLHPRNKAIFMALIAILIILLISLFATSANNKRKVSDELFNNAIASLELKQSMLDSYLLYNNLEGAKTLIGEMLVSLDELQFRGSDQEAKIAAVREKILANKSKVQKLVTIYEPELIFNFDDYNSSAETRNLLINKNKLYAADPLAKAVYIWDINANKSDSFLLSGDISALDRPIAEDNQLYYLNNQSLIKVDSDNGKQEQLKIDGFGENDKIDAFQFYNNRLYVLSADSNQIYRLNKSGESFSGRSSWLQEEASLSNALGLVINGDIFVLKNNGVLDRFRLGKKQDFAIENIDPILDSASLLKYFNNRLFVLDRTSQRLLIFEQDGSLRKQYKMPSLNNLKDFSADDKTAYLLNDDAIYKINIE